MEGGWSLHILIGRGDDCVCVRERYIYVGGVVVGWCTVYIRRRVGVYEKGVG